MEQRSIGILLHPTSLPGPHASGDLGPQAEAFADFLSAAGITWWQMLPANPPGPGNSPYSATSAFAGSPWLISPELLARDGLLRRRDLSPSIPLRSDRVDYPRMMTHRARLLRRACDAFRAKRGFHSADYLAFLTANRDWLADYALFAALRTAQRSLPWYKWHAPLRSRQKTALQSAAARLSAEIDFQQFVQFAFERQWTQLRRLCAQRGIGLIGDVPIFVAHDSADVWTHRDLFQLDPTGRPRQVSGCPPDAFNRDGQLWGHPQYRWTRHVSTRFDWWIRRFQRAFSQFDAVRIDHFLGFHRVWSVPGGAKTARSGRWVLTPGRKLLTAVNKALPHAALIAEDLGAVTPCAADLRRDFKIPGMRVLQFGFAGNDDGSMYHRPHRYPPACVAYTGTHDNETLVGWFDRIARGAAHGRNPSGPGALERSAQPPNPARDELNRITAYLGDDPHGIHWSAIRALMASPANTVIFPLQDVLGLGNQHRMNTPGVPRGNWEWRIPATPGRNSPHPASAIDAAKSMRESQGLISELRAVATAYGRTES